MQDILNLHPKARYAWNEISVCVSIERIDKLLQQIGSGCGQF